MAMMQCSFQRTQNNWRLPCELAQDFAPVQNVLGQQAFHSRPWPSPRRSKIPITAAQKPELRVQCGPTSRSKPGCRERNFWMQRQGTKNRHEKAVNACRDQSPGSKWPEIPAESPYLASTREMVVCEDWMVVEAVLCEPVSIKFPAKQGKNREIPSFLAALSVFGDHCDLNSSTCCRFP